MTSSSAAESKQNPEMKRKRNEIEVKSVKKAKKNTHKIKANIKKAELRFPHSSSTSIV